MQDRCIKVLVGLTCALILVIHLKEVITEVFASEVESRVVSSNNKTAKPTTKPIFVLHVGPPKTGTTYIQSKLQSPKIMKLLGTDHYSVIPHSLIHDDKNHNLASKNLQNKDKFELIDQLVQTVGSYRMIPGLNILGSSEYLYQPSPQECEAWKRTFIEEQNWDLQIVFTYRRLHHILPSVWDQHYKYLRFANGDLVYDENGKVASHKDWPGINNDYKILSFEDWFLKRYSKFYPQEKELSTFEIIYNKWNDCSNGIQVFDLSEPMVEPDDGRIVDDDADTAAKFICSALKEANNTCDKLMQVKKKRRRLNSNLSRVLDYDMLAVHAYESGLIGKGYQRGDVERAIREHVESNNISLPQKCPSKDVRDYIYEWSLQAERWVKALPHAPKNSTSEGLSPRQLSNFNDDWNDIVREKKLCNVDLVKVLKKDSWREFFRSKFH